MIDTSVMVAGLVDNHEFHDLARPHVVTAASGGIPGIVAAETWAALRRGPWNLDAATVEQALAPWASTDRIMVTPADSYAQVLRTGRSLNLGGNIHDLLIALTCSTHDLPLTTLDRQQATLARTLPNLSVTLLLPDE
ncbi:MAG: PIN domain-containing protein [Actinomycetota bacterium]|nr:PIN domain-containing protein [Actinomycetota bacterium]